MEIQRLLLIHGLSENGDMVDTVLHKIIMNKTKCVQLGIVDILLKQSYPLV